MPRRTNSLYVRHLPDACRAFGAYGRIVDITIPLDFFTGRMKGYAFIEFEDPRDAEDAHYNMDHARFMGREIEVEFTRGYRKTPAEMRLKDRRDDGRSSAGRRRRSVSRSRSRSRSASRRKGDRWGRSGGKRDDSRRRVSDGRGGRSPSRSRSRSRSASHNGMDDNGDNRKSSRRNDRKEVRSSRSPVARRRGSASRSRSGSY